MNIAALSLTCFLAVAGAANAASLAGDSIDAAMIRTIDTGYGVGRIHGYGLDGPFVVADGSADVQQYSGAFTLDVDGMDFSIRFLDISGWQDGTLLRLSDLDFGGDGATLVSVTVDTNLSGYRIKTRPHAVNIFLGGTSFTPDTYFHGRFNVSAVPELSSAALLALGLAFIGTGAGAGWFGRASSREARAKR